MRVFTAATVAGIMWIGAGTPGAGLPDSLRIGFHNRILLNRAAVEGLERVEVMIAARPGLDAAVAAAVAAAGGRVVRAVPAVGYLRVEVPLDRVLSVAADRAVAAFQIASLSHSAWQRDGPPRSNATNFRSFWDTPVGISDAVPPSTLPPLSPADARQPGYTGDEDTGLGAWFERHPWFDGRGVTVALLELGQPDFGNPAFATARALDGAPVAKIAGLVNVIDREEPDDTRVVLDRAIDAHGTWVHVGDRIYTLPRPGAFRFGVFALPAGPAVAHRYGVLRDAVNGDIYVDANGNASFADEAPLGDVNLRVDVRYLQLAHPRASRIAFVVAQGSAPDLVHVYVGRGGHETMTLSVLAANPPPEGLASGVAPGARVLLVRRQTLDYRLHTIVESYLAAAARPDVDLLVDASGVEPGPDTSGDFIGVVFDRIAAVYGKPIVHAAGNLQQWLANTASRGSSLTVGGSLGPATFAALFGGAPLPRLVPHHAGAAGPALDGALKPDLLAPMHRVSADLDRGGADVRFPAAAPRLRLPSGYRISCCTSASSPYAAGVVALLLSAARQSGVAVPLDRLLRAVRVGARFLDDVPSHRQGNGVIDPQRAWTELQREVDLPAFEARAPVAHPLTQYAAQGSTGPGIFEAGGWRAGQTGTRWLLLRRASGPVAPTRYALSWTGNDGTFSTDRNVVVPRATDVRLTIAVAVRSTGVHSAILNVHDPATSAIVFRTAVTIVAPEEIPPSNVLRLHGTAALMRKEAHYVRLHPGAEALAVDLEVLRGTVTVAFAPPTLLVPTEYPHVFPQYGRVYPKGRYTVVIPHPPAGTWGIDVGNVSARMERDVSLVNTGTAEYALTIRRYAAALSVRTEGELGHIVATDAGPLLREPVLDVSPTTAATHRGTFASSGLATVFDVDVPENAVTLAVDARAADTAGTPLELHLYDCTAGQCFSHALTLPADTRQRLLVRRPAQGRWKVAVNAAPVANGPGAFALNVLVSGAAVRVPLQRREPGRWSAVVRFPPTAGANAVSIELIDEALERDQTERPWETRPSMPDFRMLPVPLATATVPLAQAQKR